MRGATCYGERNYVSLFVSIHAPMRGATFDVADLIGVVSVSIHAPMRGATFDVADLIGVVSVSIHAPMRGATGKSDHWIARNIGFNPRAHAGRDSAIRSRRSVSRRFNPRAHAGRDWFEQGGLVIGLGFQSTRPCGARLQPIGRQAGKRVVSIHAPMRGATR